MEIKFASRIDGNRKNKERYGSIDKMYIRDLKINTIIGTNEEERHKSQEIIINICMYCDCKEAAKTDKLVNALDYFDVEQKVVKFVELSSYFLIEALAEEVSQICLKYTKVKAVKILIDKPNALENASSVSIEILRPNNSF